MTKTDERTVLVVDDEPAHRLMVRAVLEDEGWTVADASSGDKALALLTKTQPHVALVDMKMPGMDGLTLMRELHARMPGLPVVLLTAFGSVGSAVDAMKQGAFDYLTKPTDNDELKAVLEIPIPPLRERLEDLPLLTGFLLRKLGQKNHKEIRAVSPAFLEALTRHNWPGNVRELENVLERALILARADTFGPDLLPPQLAALVSASACAVGDIPGILPEVAPHALESAMDDAERETLLRALDSFAGHREKTADALGISRRTLQYKLKKYGLTKR